MNGVHDMGGMHGFGAIATDDTAQFHADWERLVFSMDKAVKAQEIINIDQKRHAIERMGQAEYLRSTYFERWMAAIEIMLAEEGYLTPDELETRLEEVLVAEDPMNVVPNRTDPDLAARIREAFESEASFDRDPTEPAYEEGETVRVRNTHPEGHTRCPRYARRAVGEIETVHGTFIYPDTNAHGEERAEPLYTVGFDAAELWSIDAETPNDTVHIDLWEPYLEEP
ncbi:nitrile hydratase subunit beta [Halalkalicoccus ordinarius]|uniref:nitrile hydratase subunit beta n=1 Tax=Halalkalicoccus ordinarius TaxID=3116651 RepID=UPI00300E83AF